MRSASASTRPSRTSTSRRRGCPDDRRRRRDSAARASCPSSHRGQRRPGRATGATGSGRAEPRSCDHSRWGLYNNEHRHGGIAYLTPNEVHEGRSDEVLDHRYAVRMAAFVEHPERYPRGAPRRQTLASAVYIKPPAPSLPPSSSSSPSKTERSDVRATTRMVATASSSESEPSCVEGELVH